MRWSAILLSLFAVGSYYLWELRMSSQGFDWTHEQNGYYNYLGRAFAHGRLELPIKPSPELLAAPNPWDPAVDDSYKMSDMALFNGRYYLYHGAGPAVLLFTPWRLLTGRDLPERFALFLLCFGGFAFSCGVLLRWLAGSNTPTALLALMLIALGICQSAPYLLSRVWVYEIAIAGGYFCISGALFFLTIGMESGKNHLWLGASGLLFGLAIACRPHLGLAGLIALAGLAVFLGGSFRTSRRFIAFASAFLLVGGVVAIYNYQRFGNPFEFGLRYLLAGPNQNRIRLASENILPGLYYWLGCAPDFSPVFPWVRLAFRSPFNSAAVPFPAEYFLEATTGALYLAPFAVAALFVPATRNPVRILLWVVLVSSSGILLFLSATGFTTQRYEVDFLPMLALVALANFGIYIARSQGAKRALLQGLLTVLIAFGAVASLALGITGPYGEVLKNHPKSYLRIARWFSLVERYRPMINPAVSVNFHAELPVEDFREPLVTMGRQACWYSLTAERSGGKLRLISRSDSSIVERELPAGDKQAEIHLAYAPKSGRLTALWNGREVLAHDIGSLVTAPEEVTIGENSVDLGVTPTRFTGRIDRVVRTVRE